MERDSTGKQMAEYHGREDTEQDSTDRQIAEDTQQDKPYTEESSLQDENMFEKNIKLSDTTFDFNLLYIKYVQKEGIKNKKNN